MEGAMVSSSTGAMNAVLHKLTNLIRKDHSLRQELVRMNQLLHKFATLLHKFATGEVSDAQVKEWMRQAREVAYDIEDWVDLSIHPPRRNLKRKLDQDAYDIDDRINITSEPEIAEQIQDFIDRIVGAIERYEAYHLLSKAPNADAADIADPSSCTDIGTHPQLLYENKAPLVAIRGMIDDLVDDLKDDGQEKLKVVSIVGNRGLGKTTIAKEVYQMLHRDFQCAAFVRIAGPNQPIRRILNDIYSQVSPEFCEMLAEQQLVNNLAEQQLVNNLRKYLSDKRYFVVIDGIESIRVWKSIKCALPENDCGSKIVAITRNSAVGKSCSSHPNDCMREINVLTEPDSKSLFLRLIFGSEEPSPFGRQAFDGILKICCGMPLAIIVVAGLFSGKSSLLAKLSGKSSLLEKPEILEKYISAAVNQFPTIQVMRKILHISYADLPSAVKSCFLYLSVFPENYTIKRDRLIRRWIAEGFIPNRGEGRSWETGEVYFDELVRRRLIQPVFDYDDELMMGCTVHAVIRDFLLCLSSEENFATWDEDIRCMPRDVIRRFSLDCSNQEEDDTLASSTVHISKVRSLTFFGDVKRMPDETLHCLRFLRVLDLKDTENLGNRHLEGIERLVLLRYLGLGGTGIEVLPEEIGELPNLETLDLRRTTRLTTLPASIVRLRKLMHLLLSGSVELPREIWKVQELEELSTIVVYSRSSLDSVAEMLNKSKRLSMLGVRWGEHYYHGRDLETTETYRGSVMSFLNEVVKSNLRSLLLQDYPAGDLLDLLLDSWEVPPHHLRRFELTISRRLLGGVPHKMASLVSLTHLRISIDEGETEGLRLLGDLPNLVLLHLDSSDAAPGRCTISGDGFRCLVVFLYTYEFGVMGLQFKPGAMPQLRMLRIEFSARETNSLYGYFNFGIQHLSSLQRVHATINCKDARASEVEAVEAAIREQVSQNPSSPVLELSRRFEGRLKQISEKIGGAGADESDRRAAESALKAAISEHPSTPGVNVQWVEEANRQADSRIYMSSESSSHLPIPELEKVESKSAIVMEQTTGAGRVGQLLELPAAWLRRDAEHEKVESKQASEVEDAMVSSSTGAMNSLLKKHATLMGEEYAKLRGTRKEVMILKDELGAMNALLEKLADMDELNFQMKDWRNQMREMTYDIEDCIDDLMVQFDEDNAKPYYIHQLATAYPEKWDVLQKFILQIQSLMGKGDLGSMVHKTEVQILGSSYMATESRLPAVYDKAVGLVGMDGPRDELVRWLMDGEEQQQHKVVCILGPGGLGKTTLAKEVYNKIKGRFGHLVFVPVPQKIDIPTGLLRNIRDLQDERYLIVLDGVWSVETWKYIQRALPENNPASRIIITTNIRDVAESCVSHSSGFIYHMRPLHPDDSCRLFRSIIFGSERSCPIALEKVGDKILEACGGIPSAIIIIAGFLANKPTEVAQWEMVEKHMDPVEKGDLTTEGMKKIFHICYSDLPRHMKSCLLYLSVFPGNHVIRKDRVIWRWIAEGLIPRRGEESLWETGESYFQELICRKLIEPTYVGEEDDDVPTSCKVHGVILEFITSLSNEENFLTTDAKTTYMQHGVIRRLTVSYSNQEEDDAFWPITEDLSKVRSFTISGVVQRGFPSTLIRMRFLRVLDLEDTENLGNRHLEGIGRLVLLRYLGLRGTGIDELPEEIGELQNLETLDLRRTTRLWTLPASIVGLRKLVRLLLSGRAEVPREIWKVEKLEELSTIVVGNSSSFDSVTELLIKSKRLRILGVCWSWETNFDAAHSLDSVAELLAKSKRLRMLGVRSDGGVYARDFRSFLKEVGKSNLQSLLLECYREYLLDILLDSWAPPHHLRRFELTISDILQVVPPKMASLVNLTHLRIIIDEVEAEGLPVLGALPNLILLKLESLRSDAKRVVITSRHGFRCLVVFSYTCSYDGMGLQFTPGAMPQLRRLRIEFSPRKTEYVYGNFDFGIQHLSCLTRIHAAIRCEDEEESEVEVEAAEAAITEQVSKNPNSPVLELSREIIVSGRMVRQEESKVEAADAAITEQVSKNPNSPVLELNREFDPFF